MRAKIRKSVSSEMDVLNANEMKKAIDMHGGVSGCQVAHIQIKIHLLHNAAIVLSKG